MSCQQVKYVYQGEQLAGFCGYMNLTMDSTESTSTQTRRTRGSANKSKLSPPQAIESEDSVNDYSSTTDQLCSQPWDDKDLENPDASAIQTSSTGNLLDPQGRWTNDQPPRSITPDPTPSVKKGTS